MNESTRIARVGTGWGFAVMLLGLLCILTPFVTGVAVNTMVAVIVTAAGLITTVYAFRAGTFGKGFMQFLFGGITVLGGVVMLARPMLGLLTMTAVLIAWFLVDGIFAIIAGLRGKGAPGWGWVTVSGIASVVLAILIWRQWPASGAIAIGLLVGIRLIFTGWSIAMLGMVGSAMVDAAEQAGEASQPVGDSRSEG